MKKLVRPRSNSPLFVFIKLIHLLFYAFVKCWKWKNYQGNTKWQKYYFFLICQIIRLILIPLNYILKEDTNQIITSSFASRRLILLIISLNKSLEDLKKEKRMYQKGNQELRCTIANISHDLRTPLAGIRGFSELIEERITDRKSLNYLNIIQKKKKS